MGYNFFRNLTIRLREGNARGEHIGIRVLVEVSKDNLDLVRKYIDLEIKVRHLKREPPLYFAVTDYNMMATIERMGDGDII